MGVQFILGKASVDHEVEMLNQLKKWQSENPDAKFFYLVPEHIKFESEVDILSNLADKDSSIYATSNVQVFSFTRLAWYFLRDSPILNRESLSETGLTMIITHLLNEIDSNEMTIFSQEQTQPGFAEKLAKQLIELRAYNFNVDDLKRLEDTAKKASQSNLADKLHDLGKIYSAFLDYKIDGQSFFDVFLDSIKLLEVLEDCLNNKSIENCYFLISGFDDFNATELKLIKTLIANAHDVAISLTLTDQASVHVPQTTELFHRTGKLYAKLRKIAGKDTSVIWAQENRLSESLQQLENYWISANDSATHLNYELSATQKDDITITQAPDRISEVKWMASKIRRMMAESKEAGHPYNYSDFLILTPEPEQYQNLIEPIFTQYEIPLFTDLTQSMTSHPLVELILSIFDVQKHGFNYQSIMRFLKTELFIPEQIITGRTLDLMREHDNKSVVNDAPKEIKARQTGTFRNTLDVVENYILKNGIRTLSQWKKEWIVVELGQKEDETEQELLERERQLIINRNANELRKQVVTLFENYQTKLKQVKNGRDFAVVLFEFLDEAHVSETLQRWQKAAITIQQEQHNVTDATLRGIAVDASRPEQVWNTFCQLLDEYVLALGDEPFDESTFINIFQSGFESSNYRRIPSTLDQVIFSKTSVLQMQNRKITFIIGATDNVMPARLQNDMLLNEDDLKYLNSQIDKAGIDDSKYLPETCEVSMAEEPFTNYLAFMSGSEKLFFAYPMNDNDGTELQISPYVNSIKEAFNLPLNIYGSTAPNNGQKIIEHIGNPATTASELLHVCRELKKDGSKLSPEWSAIFNYIKNDNGQRLEKIFSSLNYQNEILPNTPLEDGHKKLDADLVAQLYGNQIMGSISRLETFYQNPYEYFLKYGLKLKPRDLYEPTTANVGDYFHNVAAVLIDELQKDGLLLSNLKSDQFDEVLSRVLLKVDQLPEFQVYQQNARNRYLKGRLKKSAKKVSRALYRQHNNRKIFSLKSEATFGFGNDAELNGLEFYAQNKNNAKLLLQGRLDRIDLVEDKNHNLYYNVADYKSGSIKGKLSNFISKSMNGISLQLLTYLAVLRDNQTSILKLADANPALIKILKNDNEDILNLGSAVYFHLGTPRYTDDKFKASDEKTSQELSDKEFVYDGIFSDDPDYLDALGTVSFNGMNLKNFNNYAISFKKDGSLNSASQKKAYSPDQFNELLDMDLLKISEATDAIFSGIIDLAPYRIENENGLQYSDYQPIMTFDTLVGNKYNELPKLKDKDLMWQEIRSESKKWNDIKTNVERNMKG